MAKNRFVHRLSRLKSHIIIPVNDHLILGGKKFISSRRASQATGYTQDYVGQLIRAKKIDAQMVGRHWFVSEDSILAYKQTAAALEVAQNLLLKQKILSKPSNLISAPGGLAYARDERSLLPHISKVGVSHPVEKNAPRKPFIKTPFLSPEELFNRVVAGSLALSMVMGSMYGAFNPVGVLQNLAEVKSFGARLADAVTDTYADLGLAVVGVGQTSVNSIARGFVGARDTIVLDSRCCCFYCYESCWCCFREYSHHGLRDYPSILREDGFFLGEPLRRSGRCSTGRHHRSYLYADGGRRFCCKELLKLLYCRRRDRCERGLAYNDG